ncbi:copper resistance protein CopC [Vallicoccus soli]|uniref:copper resistance protein CopC n=1 Tax=Vallicoccus soli TaxID=2339232 RepID=UPI001403F5A2|nr:copper resistance protein CopC [Vallicoccus soli]
MLTAGARRAGAATALALALALAGAGAAAAHGQIVAEETEPVEGSRVGDPLRSLDLVFTEAPASHAFFAVTAPDGTRVDDGWAHGTQVRLREPVQEFYEVDGRWEPRSYYTGYTAEVAVAHWPARGEYVVSWASIASDGEPVVDSYAFTYDGEPTPAPEAWTAPTEGPDRQLADELTAQGVPLEGALAAEPGTVAPAGVDAAQDGEPGPATGVTTWLVLGGVVAGVVALVVAAGRRPRPAEEQRPGRSPAARR